MCVTRASLIRPRPAIAAALAALALAAVVSARAGAAPVAAPVVPAFRHVLVVTFENHERDAVMRSPTFAALARRYAQLTRYFAVTHPSLPNYLALISGSTHGITENCTSCVVDAPSLATTLTRAGRTWRAYAEGIPEPGWTGDSDGRYVKRHVPFLFFRDVLDRPAQRRRVVPLDRLAEDVRRDRLADFSLVVPDLCSSMHDCSVETGDRWLADTIVPLLGWPALRQSLVAIVFDEGTTDVRGGGNVVALLLGPAVRPGAVSSQLTGHYGLLRTIEDAWGLPRLGRSADVPPIRGVWR